VGGASGAVDMRRSLIILLLAGCPHAKHPQPASIDLRAKVVADFEHAVLTSREAYVDLFEFTTVGKFEILLHRYDANGRLELSDKKKAELLAEQPIGYPPERERRNVGNFYPILAQRTVGTGGCRAGDPVDDYAKQLGVEFEPLPADSANYEPLRAEVNAALAKGGVVGIQCTGGRGGLAVVYTRDEAQPRGYDLITIYDDEGVPGGE
jgi:hypothetical protein